jgi:hypothetical protein
VTSTDYNTQTIIEVLIAYCTSKGSSLRDELLLTFAMLVSHPVPSYQSIKVNQPSNSIHQSIHVHSCFLSFCVQNPNSANDNCDALWSVVFPYLSTTNVKDRSWLSDNQKKLPLSRASTSKRVPPSLVWRIRQINLSPAERAIRDDGSFSTRPNNGVIDAKTRKNACLWISIQQGLNSFAIDFDAQTFCKEAKIGTGSFFNADNPNHKKALQAACDMHDLTINMYMVRTDGQDNSSWIDKSDRPLFVFQPKSQSAGKGQRPVALALAYWLNQHFELITNETPVSEALDLGPDCITEYHQYLHAPTQWHQKAPQKVIHPSVPTDDQSTQLPCIYPIDRPCFRLAI